MFEILEDRVFHGEAPLGLAFFRYHGGLGLWRRPDCPEVGEPRIYFAGGTAVREIDQSILSRGEKPWKRAWRADCQSSVRRTNS